MHPLACMLGIAHAQIYVTRVTMVVSESCVRSFFGLYYRTAATTNDAASDG